MQAQPKDQILAGRFRLDAECGTGGMGTVYRATDLHSGATVALKVLTEKAGGSADRFNQEAALLAELQHPAIVRYVDHGITAAGEHYLAMEWLEGETLEDRVANGPLGIIETARLGRRLLEALAVAHRKEIIHRDIKPANLFLPRGDLAQVKVLDFGIARRLFDSRRITLTGSTLGTPMYMAPEQARGAKDIDARADIFSVGCVLFECLTGTPPFVADSPMAVLAQICLDESINVRARCPSVPPPFATLIGRMLAKDRDNRPGSAAHLTTEMAWLVDQLVATGGGAGPVPPSTPTPMLTVGEQRVLSAVMISQSRDMPELGMEQGAAVRTWDMDQGSSAVGPLSLVDELTFGELQKVVAPLGARLDRFVGGSMVITLVGHRPPTDQAADAARCALKVRSLVPMASIAVATGRAVAGTDLPIGKVIESAARLLVGESPGVVCVDDITATLLEARFEIGGQGKRHLLFEKGQKEGPRTLLGKEVPCVGRDREIANLEGLWSECVSEEVARAVLVTAQAGTGKSRVRHELFDRIQGRGEAFEYLIGRGDPMRVGSPFGLLGPALRAAAGISGGEPVAVAQKRLVAHIARRMPGEAGRKAAAFLGELAGIPFPDDDLPALRAARQDPRMMADQMMAAWLDWLEAECAARPVLVVMEDLHWGDAPSVQFIDAALRTLRERPFMVLAFARPEVDEKFPGLWAERDVQRMSLPPLGPKSCQKLVAHVLGAVPPETAARIVERADGNPFFLEELLRAVASGVDITREGALPETVIGMVQARFDAFGAEAKRVLRAASVYGQTFRPMAVKALLGDETVSVDEWLEILTTREVVFPRAAGGGREFIFRHALLRDAAYDMLTPDDRVLGHRLAGEFLEQAGEREAIVLVEHFERGGVLPRAAHWSRFAAAQALDANDLGAAIERVERGVRFGAVGETLGFLRLTEAQARVWRGEYGIAEHAAQEALAHLQRGARLLAMSELFAALGQQARFEELERRVREVMKGPPAPEERKAWLACLVRGATFLLPGGRYDLVQEFLDDLSSHEDELDAAVRARLSNTRAHIAAHAGLQAQALVKLEEALRLFEALGDARNAAEVTGNIGVMFADMGVLEEAERHLASALATAERMDLGFITAVVLLNLAQVRAHMGKLDAARGAGERARDLARRQGDRRAEGGAELYMSVVAYLAGRAVDAQRHAEAAIEAFQGVPMLPAAMAAHARALLAQGRAAEALVEAVDACARLDTAGRIEDGETLIRLVAAECYLAVGERAKARDVLIRARARLEQRAAAIEKPEWRQTFLCRIPDHARTNALAAETLI